MESVVGDFDSVTLFEKKVAKFFGAKHGVATDCNTHALELALEVSIEKSSAFGLYCPSHTYLSVPLMLDRVCQRHREKDITWSFTQLEWFDNYYVSNQVIDAAVTWRKDAYKREDRNNTFMCLSFQHKKHLSLGRGGMILTNDGKAAERLRRLAYDGRARDTPWAEQEITEPGFHYYMTPETAALGLAKLDEACSLPAALGGWDKYPNISQQPVFSKCQFLKMSGRP